MPCIVGVGCSVTSPLPNRLKPLGMRAFLFTPSRIRAAAQPLGWGVLGRGTFMNALIHVCMSYQDPGISRMYIPDKLTPPVSFRMPGYNIH
jgi:hypothetical protein